MNDPIIVQLQNYLDGVADNLEQMRLNAEELAADAAKTRDYVKTINLESLIMANANEIVQHLLTKAKSDDQKVKDDEQKLVDLQKQLDDANTRTIDQATLDDAAKFTGDAPADTTSGTGGVDTVAGGGNP